MRAHGPTFQEKSLCFICDFWWLILLLLGIVLGLIFTRCLWLPDSCPARIQLQNSSPYELKVVLLGEESETIILPKCTNCEVYEGSGPDECPRVGTKKTQELDPGIFGIEVSSTDNSLDPLPYIGILTVSAHELQKGCFIATEAGLTGLGLNLEIPLPTEEPQPTETAEPTEAAATEAPNAAFIPGTVIPAAIERDGLTLGNTDAPILVEEYGDFQCSHCKTAHDLVVTPLINDFVSTGEVKFIFHSFNFLGPGSTDAANSVFCAEEQNKQWEMLELLFANQTGFDQEMLLGMGEYIGLEMSSFTTCIQDGRYYAQVQTDLDEGSARGVGGTPTFFINGNVVATDNVLNTVESLINE